MLLIAVFGHALDVRQFYRVGNLRHPIQNGGISIAPSPT
jgi:hypothetical protein